MGGAARRARNLDWVRQATTVWIESVRALLGGATWIEKRVAARGGE